MSARKRKAKAIAAPAAQEARPTEVVVPAAVLVVVTGGVAHTYQNRVGLNVVVVDYDNAKIESPAIIAATIADVASLPDFRERREVLRTLTGYLVDAVQNESDEAGDRILGAKR
jgi:fructose-specific component phosphotransferase system IIB-like protein